MLWVLLLAGAMSLSLWLLKRPHRYWLDRGVPQGKPVLLFGHIPLFKKQSCSEIFECVYNMFPNNRYFGFYQFFTPTIVLRDPDLIKQVTVKDFEHFVDHRALVPHEDTEPLLTNNLFALSGKRWRDMRATLSPAFTGSKLKFMFAFIAKNSQLFVKHFLNKNEDIVTVEMKDAFTRFTNDVIASTAFGIECDSLSDGTNEFYLMGKEVTDLGSFWKSLKMFAFSVIPKVLKVFKIAFYTQKVSNFFNGLVISNIESRKKHSIVRPDMIHILLEARKHNSNAQKAEITNLDITSQALLFFFAAFDTLPNHMCFLAHELAINPDIQDRLLQEIDQIGELTYEALSGMKYMDMVISEALRKWPNAAITDRVCTKSYTIEPKGPEELPVRLEKGTLVWLPIYGIHRDPQYWPQPEKFDPERFNDENKSQIVPCTYLPFGSGPRRCIGPRLAQLQTKILFFYLLSQFRIVPVEKTQVPLVISKNHFNMTAESGFWLGLERRNV